jgi:hypothetical protein
MHDENENFEDESFPLDDDLDMDEPMEDMDFGLDEEDPDRDS